MAKDRGDLFVGRDAPAPPAEAANVVVLPKTVAGNGESKTADIPMMVPGTNIDVKELGKLLVQSGYFQDTRQISQAVVKVLLGQELGIPPVTSMMGVYIVDGKPTLSSGLMASTIIRSGRYLYRILEHTDEVCKLEFFAVDTKTKTRESLGVSAFTIADANKAGLTKKDNWKNYGRNMLFARALSNGAKWYCPDVFGGPVYSFEEADELRDIDRAPAADAPDEIIVPVSRTEQLKAALSDTPEPGGK